VRRLPWAWWLHRADAEQLLARYLGRDLMHWDVNGEASIPLPPLDDGLYWRLEWGTGMLVVQAVALSEDYTGQVPRTRFLAFHW
jgi:hypothetical protein